MTMCHQLFTCRQNKGKKDVKKMLERCHSIYSIDIRVCECEKKLQIVQNVFKF